jgi:hypothetical protein
MMGRWFREKVWGRLLRPRLGNVPIGEWLGGGELKDNLLFLCNDVGLCICVV